MTTSYQIRNQNNDFTDISNIFKIDTAGTATDDKYKKNNTKINFVPIINYTSLNSELKNSVTGFQIDGEDISKKYLCNYTKIYTEMLASETIPINNNNLYTKIVFFCRRMVVVESKSTMVSVFHPLQGGLVLVTWVL